MKFLVLTFFAISTVQSAPATENTGPHSVFDQKQTGDFNIQVHLKDVSIIGIIGDELLGDYDYSYDYSDFTVKPPGANNITLKPEETSSTEKQPTTASSTEKPTESTSASSTSEKTSTEKVGSVPFSTSSPDKIKVQILEDPNVAIVPADDMGVAHASPVGEAVQVRRCANGYTRDKKGRCRRVRRPGHQHHFDISRLANNLAARIRGSTSGEELLGEK